MHDRGLCLSLTAYGDNKKQVHVVCVFVMPFMNFDEITTEMFF